jgi:Domain of unknown function (DUF5916)/Carbohydrate family 9 binding domain-like
LKLTVVFLAALTLVPCLAAATPAPSGVEGQGPRVSPIDGPPEPVPPAVASRDEAGHVTIRAIPLTEPLTLDGRLDERLYHDTDAISDFIQQEPLEGRPATEKTEVWVAYDEDAIYVGARLWESDPSKRVTSDMRRDANNLYNNDHFGILLDTFYDRRNGYVFFANSQGGMSDLQVVNENATSDWNAIWETRAANFDGGWTIEFRIPFRSIRFDDNGRIWGINFRRFVRWKSEPSFLTHIPASYARAGLNRTANAATLVGIEAPGGLRNIDIKGYALGSTVTNRTVAPAISNQGDGEFGADVKWGMTQSYVADFTYNTDFAQVEDDEQQVNLTRFNLLFPEKREFFVEGAQFFSFGTQGGTFNNAELPTLFFSRRIGLENGAAVPIVGGGRLMGKSGPYRIGLLQMRTDDAPAVNAPATDFSVIRVQRDILRRSRMGVMATRRAPSSTGAARNYSYGVDSMLQVTDNTQITHYLARTETPGRNGSDISYRSRWNWNPDRWAIDVEHLYTGEDFNPEVGFHRRTEGFRRTHGKFEFSPRPRNLRGVRKLAYSADVDYFADAHGGRVQSRDRQALFRVDFESGDVAQFDAVRTYEAIVVPFVVAKDVRVLAGSYDYTVSRASYTFGSQRKVSGTASTRYGSFYGGDLRELSWRSRIEFSPQLYAEPTVTWNDIEGPFGDGNNNLVSTRLTYTVSPRMFLSALVQYQSRTDAVSTNARFRWEYQPGSELFIVYNDGRNTLTRGIPDIQNRSFVIKVTRLFQL